MTVARVRIDGSDIEFEADREASVLDAALRAGIALPYSCRKGVCGNCATRVVQGEVNARAGMSLHHEACAPGQVLLCACSGRSGHRAHPMATYGARGDQDRQCARLQP